MILVTEIKTQKEFDEMKAILEVFVVNNRIRELAQLVSQTS